ncbi:AAA family ATPase [Microdochium nivale]|nr:AAA family ATPase [Microdochium nivale]
MAIHWIREADVAFSEDQDVFSIRTSWDQTPRQIAVADPTVNQKQIQWYLDEFAAKDPLAAQRAAEARHILQRCCESISTQASPPPTGHGDEGATRGPRLVDVVAAAAGDGSRMYAAPWEAIEAEHPDFVIRRRVETLGVTTPHNNNTIRARPPASPSSSSVTSPPSPGNGVRSNSNTATFNILLVAARASKADAALYGQVARPLARVIDALPSQGAQATRVTLDIARPGTLAALKERLESASAAGEPYQLVHFDLHGKIEGKKAWLCFTDGPVQGRRVASLLAAHGVTFAVLNACNSASAASVASVPRSRQNRRGLIAAAAAAAEANLARVLVEHSGGVSHVFAMSYRLQISAVESVTTAFYAALLRDGLSFARSAAAARRAMRNDPARVARFGLEVPLMDWIVPVVYTSCLEDPVVVALPRTAAVVRPGKFLARAGRRRTAMMQWPGGPVRVGGQVTTGKLEHVPKREREEGHGHLRGRDGDILELETRLAQNKEAGVTHPLLVAGERGCGKTTLLRDLARWWPRTGWVSRVVYLDLEATPAETPTKLIEMVAQALNSEEVKSPAGSGAGNGGEGGRRLDRNGVSRGTLVILDHFQVSLPFKLKAGDLTRFYAAAREWKACLAGLSLLATHTIVASYHFPWYIDESADTTWPWTAYYQLGPLAADTRLAADVASTERSLRGMLGTRRDCDVFAEISAWAGVDVALHEAVVSLCRARGVRAVSRLLRTNTDLLASEGFDAAAGRVIARSRAYRGAECPRCCRGGRSLPTPPPRLWS